MKDLSVRVKQSNPQKGAIATDLKNNALLRGVNSCAENFAEVKPTVKKF
jgi:hypothetical protein